MKLKSSEMVGRKIMSMFGHLSILPWITES